MRFKELYNMDEKFTGNFFDRDFGDATPTIVELPSDIEYSRIETYVHDKDTIHTYIYDKEGKLSYFAIGDLDNILQSIQKITDNNRDATLKAHPSNLSSFFEYSGVEPIKPPIQGYDGPYNIPSEFNMSKFNDYGSFSGVRTDDDWNLN
jgi:hypothetical protein